MFILVRVYAARGAEEEELEVVTMTYNEEILDSWILLRCKDFFYLPKVLPENVFSVFKSKFGVVVLWLRGRF